MKKLMQALIALGLPAAFFYFAASSLMNKETAPALPLAGPAAQVAVTAPAAAIALTTQTTAATTAPIARSASERNDSVPDTRVHQLSLNAKNAAPAKMAAQKADQKANQMQSVETEVSREAHAQKSRETHGAKNSVRESSVKVARQDAREKVKEKKLKQASERQAKLNARNEARRTQRDKLAAARAAKQAKVAARADKIRRERAETQAELSQYVADRQDRNQHAEQGDAPVLPKAQRARQQKLSEEDPNALVLNNIEMEVSEDSDEAARKMSKNAGTADTSFDRALYQ